MYNHLISKKNKLDDLINGNFFYFEGYEEGAVEVKFAKIYKDNKKKEYVFDGFVINYATLDSQFDGDGILIWPEVEGMTFKELPYGGHFTTVKDILKYVNGWAYEYTL